MPAPYETHRAQLKAILLAWGMPEENAETTADILGWADLHGVDSHGISMLPGYDRLRRAGRALKSFIGLVADAAGRHRRRRHIEQKRRPVRRGCGEGPGVGAELCFPAKGRRHLDA